MDHVNVVGFGAAMSFLDSCLAAHGIFPKVLQTYFDTPMLILLAFVPSLRNTCMYINGFAKLMGSTKLCGVTMERSSRCSFTLR